MQGQLESLYTLQMDMANYINHLSRNYRIILEEINSFRGIISAQDQLMQNIVHLLSYKSNADGKLEWRN